MQLKDQDPRRFGVRTYRDADGNLKSVDVDANADEIRKALTIRFDAIHKVDDYLSSGLSSAQSSLTKENFDRLCAEIGISVIEANEIVVWEPLPLMDVRPRTRWPAPLDAFRDGASRMVGNIESLCELVCKIISTALDRVGSALSKRELKRFCAEVGVPIKVNRNGTIIFDLVL